MYQLNSVPKPQHKRFKPSQRMLGAISTKVRKEVKERSQGLCEVRMKCNGSYGVHMAHLTSRKSIKHKTTKDDLKHTCLACHKFLDEDPEGIKYKRRLTQCL